MSLLSTVLIALGLALLLRFAISRAAIVLYARAALVAIFLGAFALVGWLGQYLQLI